MVTGLLEGKVSCSIIRLEIASKTTKIFFKYITSPSQTQVQKLPLHQTAHFKIRDVYTVWT